jgi:hypothetical protein
MLGVMNNKISKLARTVSVEQFIDPKTALMEGGMFALCHQKKVEVDHEHYCGSSGQI